MLRACALVLLCGVPVASPALVSPIVACSWLLPCATPGSGAVGGLHPEDAVVVFARSCGSDCNKPPTHTFSFSFSLETVIAAAITHDTPLCCSPTCGSKLCHGCPEEHAGPNWCSDSEYDSETSSDVDDEDCEEDA